ncbi:MAG: putative selenium-dependent hydroxylase accessory protein YqeC [Deltaproteobacteria bacterium]|nr:putative selenium-dependent hydroxylase accessory protein YqeC [Deltaproteobacteria bacterium]
MASLRDSLMLEDGGVVAFVGAGGKTSLMFRIAHELSKADGPVLSTTTTKIMMPDRNQSPHVILADTPEEVLKKAEALLKDNIHLSAAAGKLPYQDKLVGFQPEYIDVLFKAGMFRWILLEGDGAAGRPLKVPKSNEPVIPKCAGWVVGVVGLDCIGKPLEERWVYRSDIYAEVTGLKMGEPVTEASIAAAIINKKGIMKGCPSNAMRFVFLNKADRKEDLEAGRRIARLLKTESEIGIERIIIGKALDESPVVEYY